MANTSLCSSTHGRTPSLARSPSCAILPEPRYRVAGMPSPHTGSLRTHVTRNDRHRRRTTGSGGWSGFKCHLRAGLDGRRSNAPGNRIVKRSPAPLPRPFHRARPRAARAGGGIRRREGGYTQQNGPDGHTDVFAPWEPSPPVCEARREITEKTHWRHPLAQPRGADPAAHETRASLYLCSHNLFVGGHDLVADRHHGLKGHIGLFQRNNRVGDVANLP